MGVRIGLGAAIISAAIVLAAATGPVAPAHAADSAISYNEITRIVMKGTPAPGSYNSGSFDSDWAAATTKVKSPFPVPKLLMVWVVAVSIDSTLCPGTAANASLPGPPMNSQTGLSAVIVT